MTTKKILLILIPLLLLIFLYLSIHRSNTVVVRGMVVHDPIKGYGIKTSNIFFYKINWDFILSAELQHEGIEVKCVRRVADVIGMTPKDVMYDVQCTQIK